MMISK